jgi:competence protein ComEC
MKLVYAGAAWLAGIWIASAVALPAWAWLAACAAATAATIPLRRTRAALPLLCAVFLCLGAWRYGTSLPRIDVSHVAWYNDRGQTAIVGVVSGEPDPDGALWRARIAADEIWHPFGYAQVSGLVLATMPAYPRVHDGDRVRLAGELVTPPVWEDFSYKDYLAREGVHSLMYRPSVEVLQSAERRGVSWVLGQVRARGEAFLARFVPEPEASLLSGILLGRDKGIADNVMDAFRDTGTAHIIAISGFNITILCGMLLAALTRTFGRRWAVYGTVPAVVAYTVLVGGDPPVVRAAIMGCLTLVALQLGRRSDALNALAITALVMTAARPLALWDVGFQLSFAATLGIILYAEPLHRRVGGFISARVPQEWAKVALGWLGTGFVATLAAQTLTLPISVAYFRNLSPVSLLANLFILPAQPQVMAWGGSALLLGLVWGPLGVPVAWVAWLFAAYTVRVAELFAALPGASLQVARVPAAVIIGYYVIVAALTFSSGRMRRWLSPALQRWARAVKRWRLAGGLAILAVLVWVAALQMPDGRLHVHFLQVGEGDAVLIRTPNGRTVLIDGGSDPSRLLSEIGKRLPFWDRDIDLVALTHPHADHAGGLIGVLQRYDVGVFVEARSGSTPEYKACIAAIQARGIPRLEAAPGQRFVLDDGVVLEALFPSPQSDCRTLNDCSLVLRLSMGSASFLFPGDLEEMGQIALLNERDIPPTMVLKVSHHGGETALQDGFLAAVSPQIAVIQSGPRTAADPHPTTLRKLEAAGATIWQTRLQGSLEVVTDGVKYWLFD